MALTVIHLAFLSNVAASHGYWIVAVIVALESMGLPLPGEATLIAAALYAGATHRLEIAIVVAVAMAGAVVGNCAGFLIGRRFRGVLLRRGHLLGVSVRRLRFGQWLIDRHGGVIVFFGRFIVVLRTLAGLVAGLSSMSWRRFMVFNSTSAAVWAVGYGAAAYLFGARVEHVAAPMALAMGALGAAAAVTAILAARRQQSAFDAETAPHPAA
jgi:membrane protein DedA with SNARE-associated domain